jgi:molybdenum cofactor cytidylyltransferase
MATPLCAVVLAAGLGSRYQAVAGEGASKLLAPCVGRDGIERPVLEQVLLNLRGVVDKCLVITRPDQPDIARIAHQYHCTLLQLDSPGMGDSIAAAVAAEPDCAGWLVVLGDMPFILPETLQAIAASVRADAISVPVYQGERGHPVGFGRELGAGLMSLSGDRGARRLFDTATLQLVEVTDSGVVWDVDVPQALVFSR